jgi:hypothetical protein
MNLKRFQIIHKLFIIFPILITEFCYDLPRYASIFKRKLTARDARSSANINDKGNLPPDYWAKVEFLIIYIREICIRMYIPGTYIIINKIILAFRGRYKDVIKFKNKLISENFKNWVLAEHGYIWNWE